MDADALRDHLVAELGDAVEPEVSYGTLTATVAPGDWRRVAELAQRGPDLACNFFDFLCGVDEEADGIAVVLHVYSTSHRHHLQVRTVVARDGGHLPTLSDLWAGADWHERETAELFGVGFDGHPNLAKLLLPEEFEGHPLRKEFALLTREAKPWPGAKEPGSSVASELERGGAAFQAADGTGVGIILRDKADRELHTQDMTLNVGPQHPATHGVLRVLVTLDGEMIEDAQPVIGYMHRSFEKLAEYRDYRQIIALVNRHDWVSSICNELGVALVVERQMELEVPERRPGSGC